MDYFKYCDIKDLKPNARTILALQKIEKQTRLSWALKSLVATVPLYKIFIEPSPKHKEVYDALTYDWNEFEKVMSKVDALSKRKIGDIASMEAMNPHD
ncbi:hypothetical protein [Endozoicomonas numazuensis]|uniref:Uncharacterized protein n=1 Tax=Endozoicomonas numazuensis TaxID=1137799 RepID=A0A081N9A5_9GAMM|nr:hypothetical protein [Endozoicomonas numazuensis]KEQ15028.1 hypothetical protein GZ78_24410 [Endozoicomonas numazuensis]